MRRKGKKNGGEREVEAENGWQRKKSRITIEKQCMIHFPSQEMKKSIKCVAVGSWLEIFL